MNKTLYNVCIPHTNRDFYSYTANGCNAKPGSRVWVPFRKSLKLGVILAIGSDIDCHITLKPIERVIDEEPLLDKDMLTLCQWVASYYQAPLSEVLPLALPKHYRNGKEAILPHIEYYQPVLSLAESKKNIPKNAVKQQALMDFLHEQAMPVTKKTLQDAGFSTIILQKLLALDLVARTLKPLQPFPERFTVQEPLPLNEEQAVAVTHIQAALNQYHCFLLQGVTGSGKTEVYLQVISKVLEAGKQVLILVPEIGLTPQMLARFTERFQYPLAVIHSRLNDTERQIAWHMAKEKQVKLIIGTRAAVFTPLPDLGLIVVDEEHDPSLKQMEGVRYSARDTALIRAFNANIPIILGSATPSLESMHNSLQGKYRLLKLNHKALTAVPLHYQLVDIRNQTLRHGLSTKVLDTIKTHLEQDNQVLVFINRRGFAPVLLCHGCGWMADCTACDSHLTLHRKKNRMICHHCGAVRNIPLQCTVCCSRELLPIGAGTQRIHEFLHTCFPENRLLRIDRDAVGGKQDLEQALARIHAGETQLMVGTQMLAKGHHFPRLTLVVVLDADAGLLHHDFRALEHLGQLLTQVSGRAGRAQYPGQVLIQTHQPQHPLLLTLVSEGYEAFARNLLQTRKMAQLPPWHFLALIRAQAKKQESVLQFLHLLKNRLTESGMQILGPAPAPLARKGYQHRMQLLIKSSSRKKLQHTLTQLREWLTMNFPNHGVRWNVDVDPMDLS